MEMEQVPAEEAIRTVELAAAVVVNLPESTDIDQQAHNQEVYPS